ncbi:MAG: PAS domain S-box protein [Arenicellales bacterium]
MPSKCAVRVGGRQFLSTLLKNLPGMAYRFANDGNWTIEYASEGALALTGWMPDELVRNPERTILKLVHPQDAESARQMLEEALTARRPYQLSYRLETKDGQIKWAFEQGQGVFGANGQLEAVEGFISDVTRQKEAEMALAQSEHRYRSIFQNAIFGIYQSTPDGKFVVLNPEAARILGCPEPDRAFEEITNIATDLYADPKDRERFLDAIRSHPDGLPYWEYRIRRRDGSIGWVAEKSRGTFGPDGELLYIEGMVRDISEEVAARTALHESERKASELRAQLADAQLRALKLQLKPHFLFNVLNTVAMLIRVGETAKAQNMVVLLGELFRCILEFEGEDTVTLEQELKFCELYLNVQRFRFEDRLEIERRVDDSLLPSRVPTLMLQPIAENAIKHGVAKVTGRCRVEVSARTQGDSLVLEISNDATSEDDDSSTGHGIGLTNTRSRLHELYGDRAGFELVHDGRRARAILSIPMGNGPATSPPAQVDG